MSPKTERNLSFLLAVISFILITVLCFIHDQKKDAKIKQLDSHIQEIFDKEVKEAIARCTVRDAFIPVKYFPQYDVDCDDLSVIGDPDPEMEGI